MEHRKTLSLLNEAKDYKFFTRKWKFDNEQPNKNYDVENEIVYNTEIIITQKLSTIY